MISGSIAARPHMDGSLFPLWQRFFPCSRHDFVAPCCNRKPRCIPMGCLPSQVPFVAILRKCGMQRKCSTAELGWTGGGSHWMCNSCVSHGDLRSANIGSGPFTTATTSTTESSTAAASADVLPLGQTLSCLDHLLKFICQHGMCGLCMILWGIHFSANCLIVLIETPREIRGLINPKLHPWLFSNNFPARKIQNDEQLAK